MYISDFIIIGILLSIPAIITCGMSGVAAVWIGMIIWAIMKYNSRQTSCNNKIGLNLLAKTQYVDIQPEDIGLEYQSYYQKLSIYEFQLSEIYREEIRSRNSITSATYRFKRDCFNWVAVASRNGIGESHTRGHIGYDADKKAYYREFCIKPYFKFEDKISNSIEFRVYSEVYNPSGNYDFELEPKMAQYTREYAIQNFLERHGEWGPYYDPKIKNILYRYDRYLYEIAQEIKQDMEKQKNEAQTQI